MAQWRIREEAEIPAYNAAAVEIAESEGLPVNDLHDVIVRNDFAKCIDETGVHLTKLGNELVSDAVVTAIRALM